MLKIFKPMNLMSDQKKLLIVLNNLKTIDF